MLPKYDSATKLTYPPRKLRLIMPNSGIGIIGGKTTIDDDQIQCVMTQCDVVIEEMFSNGIPRIATISLSLAQIPQIGGVIVFPARNEATDKALVPGENPKYLGYNLVSTYSPVGEAASTTAGRDLPSFSGI